MADGQIGACTRTHARDRLVELFEFDQHAFGRLLQFVGRRRFEHAQLFHQVAALAHLVVRVLRRQRPQRVERALLQVAFCVHVEHVGERGEHLRLHERVDVFGERAQVGDGGGKLGNFEVVSCERLRLEALVHAQDEALGDEGRCAQTRRVLLRPHSRRNEKCEHGDPAKVGRFVVRDETAAHVRELALNEQLLVLTRFRKVVAEQQQFVSEIRRLKITGSTTSHKP